MWSVLVYIHWNPDCVLRNLPASLTWQINSRRRLFIICLGALSDFDKPATPSAKKVITQSQNPDDQKVAETNTTESHVHDEKEPNEDELSKIFAESFAEAAADLEEAMKNMGGAQDADFMANLNQLASSAQQAASKGIIWALCGWYMISWRNGQRSACVHRVMETCELWMHERSVRVARGVASRVRL